MTALPPNLQRLIGVLRRDFELIRELRQAERLAVPIPSHAELKQRLRARESRTRPLAPQVRPPAVSSAAGAPD